MQYNDERDFYGDAPEEKGEVISYCFYCKNEIHENEEYVEYKGHMYHKECFLIENTGIELGINDN